MGPYSTDTTGGEPPTAPAVDPFLGFAALQSVLPLDPARALIAEPPLAPLVGVTSLSD